MQILTLFLAGLLCLGASTARSEDFEAQVTDAGRYLAAEAKDREIAALLRNATALRQQLRRTLFERGFRVTKEKTGETTGFWGGSFLSFSGSVRQESYDLLVTGGEHFILTIVSPETKKLMEDLRKRSGICMQRLRRRLEPMANRAIEPDEVARLKGEVKRFQALLDRAELELGDAPASDAERQQLSSLMAWGRGSLLKVVTIATNPYELFEAEWYTPGVTTGAWWIQFSTPGVHGFHRRCLEGAPEEHLETLLRLNVPIATEEVPIY